MPCAPPHAPSPLSSQCPPVPKTQTLATCTPKQRPCLFLPSSILLTNQPRHPPPPQLQTAPCCSFAFKLPPPPPLQLVPLSLLLANPPFSPSSQGVLTLPLVLATTLAHTLTSPLLQSLSTPTQLPPSPVFSDPPCELQPPPPPLASIVLALTHSRATRA